jgi:beta-glucosidase
MTSRRFPDGFLWGASSAAHQVEGGNHNSDWWRREQDQRSGLERSGDACDSFHRYEEDIQLLADAGLTSYRFSLEWARIEPSPGHLSDAALAHYRRMIDAAFERGITPVVTLHHFTSPWWFAKDGGWLRDDAVERFARYAEAATAILGGVEWVATINEPNVLAAVIGGLRRRSKGRTLQQSMAQPPDLTIGATLIEAHRAASGILCERTSAKVGWTVAMQAFEPTPGNEATHAEVQRAWEDLYLDVSREDDFLGVQSYTSQLVDASGVVPHADAPDNTLTGWAYRPDALGMALRRAREVVGDVPLMVTENGIATDDDARRIDYTREALGHLLDVLDEGADIRGYLHWSLLDNYEWGHWDRPFGLVAVERRTFKRRPKPSLGWLGSVARANALQPCPPGEPAG